MTTSNLFQDFRRIQEAHAIRHSLPVSRAFSDADLAEADTLVAQAEAELYGADRLSPSEREMVGLTVTSSRRQFVVTYSIGGITEQINMLAPDACAAVVRTMELLLDDNDASPPESFKIKVEPAATARLRRAA